ncbi:MAG TPA: AAA family ATPase, partial [Acidimicrobiales bacterium]
MDSPALTRREEEVASVAARGGPTQAIAEELGISVRTVESHLAAIYRKLDVGSRPELVALFAARGGSAGRSTRDVGSGSLIGYPPAPPSAFVGRIRERAVIAAAIAAADDGPTVILVAGESGVGKSALIAAAVHQSAASEAAPTVIGARCVEDMAVPFGPVLDAVGPLLEDHPGSLADLTGPTGGILAALCPNVADRLPGVPGAVPPGAHPKMVVDALTHVLRVAASRRPVVLVLDDLQWVDRATASFVRQLVDSPNPIPLVMLAGYRNAELPGSHPLPGLLAELWRLGSVQPLDLGGLELQDAKALARELGRPGLADELVERAHAASAGNAFYLD